MKWETLVSYPSSLNITGQYGNRGIEIIKANHPQIIKASVIKNRSKYHYDINSK